ncbi:hypothetical protein FLL65_04185 [Vibrio cholerae]|uniref:Uncharacterized protein n=1 Tax=Vibrio cholerae TaxID=666 RepID=A0A544I8X1_VIBCL|nr:hypothetical protein [Vibrio cholerae]MVC99934.1 hypothetical protein [Vibrio cholerae]MVD02805.1 hypothetical protein [Vibrio cholerae]MVD34801.1 hypothetical protein [Vibrio cholerae]MVD75802.1 hypothetical protein [Vibrio cholerae]
MIKVWCIEFKGLALIFCLFCCLGIYLDYGSSLRAIILLNRDLNDFMNYFFLIIFKFSMSLLKIMKVSLHLLTSV